MIIFGSNTGLIKMDESPKATCSRCNEIGYLKMSRYVKYFHLFWIPTFPYGTESLSHCGNCENILNYEEMSKDEQIHYAHFKEFARLPIWSFSGLIIIAGIIAWSFISSDFDKETTRKYSQSPLKGDVCYW